MSTRERSWPVPVALVALSAIPLTAGTLRLIQLAAAARPSSPPNVRFARFLIPPVLHVLRLSRCARRRLALSTGPQEAGALS